MKRRRKNKGGTRFYMVMSILCLTALFLGYSFVYKLSEERKSGKEITTISINYNTEKKENALSTFDKIMSYFNIFLEKTLEKKDEDVFIENTEPQSKDEDEFIENTEPQSKDSLEIFNEKDYIPGEKKEVDLTKNRKENFFRVVASSSRSSKPRKLFVNTDSIGNGLNIVLFHTHGTEAFDESYDANYRTLDENLNIVGIGNRIAENLQKTGIKTVHLKDYNDYPDYKSSYANSNYAVKQLLSGSKKNVLIDIHRDGAEENSSYERFLSSIKTIDINEKTAATCSIVVGNKNENNAKLKENAGKLYEIAHEMYPGLIREIIIREGAYFNQYLSDYSMLIEVGCTLNSFEEVQYTADLLTDVLYEYITEISK